MHSFKALLFCLILISCYNGTRDSMLDTFYDLTSEADQAKISFGKDRNNLLDTLITGLNTIKWFEAGYMSRKIWIPAIILEAKLFFIRKMKLLVILILALIQNVRPIIYISEANPLVIE
jgi:hypothetical protein